MRNDTRPCTSGALGETRTPASWSLSYPQSSWVCRKLLGASILYIWDQPLSLTGGWWISTSVFTLHTVLVRTTCECLPSNSWKCMSTWPNKRPPFTSTICCFVGDQTVTVTPEPFWCSAVQMKHQASRAVRASSAASAGGGWGVVRGGVGGG
jgi:hypothetical protein